MRIVAILAALAGVACTSGMGSELPAAGESQPTRTRPAPVESPASTPSTPAAEPPHPVSVPALIQKDFDGRALRVERVLGRSDAYTRYAVSYLGGGLRISGLMNVPNGEGPFPVLVLAHGYIDPDVYTRGRGYERAQDVLPRQGFAILHVDYRNHAESGRDPDNDMRLRLGYTEDVINAVLAVKRSDLPYLDGERVGLLGRSMGGGVAFTVAVVAPRIVDAIAVHAPVSSDAVDNFERWIRRPARAELAQRIIDAYGSPADNPSFWANASARTFFERVAVPIQIHHGVEDDTCPIAWSEETLAALRAAGKDAELIRYPGEGHAFGAAYLTSMRRTAAFFDEHLSAAI